MAYQGTEEGIKLGIANPTPLGYGAFGILFWMHGMIFAGWFPQAYGTQVEEVSTVFALCVLLVAGVLAFLRRRTWDGTLFLFWSAMEFAYVQARDNQVEIDGYHGWLWLMIAVFHAFLAWRAFQGRDRDLYRGFIALGVVVAGVGWTLTQWGLSVAQIIGPGYAEMAAGLVAFWVSATELGVVGGSDGPD